MAETAVKESKDRVRSALINSQFTFPQQRITINLASSPILKKKTAKRAGRLICRLRWQFLAASNQIRAAYHISHMEFIGELGTTGELRAVRGVLPTAYSDRQKPIDQLMVHLRMHKRRHLTEQGESFAAKTLLEVCAHLTWSTCVCANELINKQLIKIPMPI